MNSRIIYPTDDGGVAVIVPAAECGLTIEEIAAKDVPPMLIEIVNGEGVGTVPRPYKIVDVSEVPSDRTFRAAWEYTE
jgi:hypothetical protein